MSDPISYGADFGGNMGGGAAGGGMFPYQDGAMAGGGGGYPGTVARGLGGNEAQAVVALDKAYNKPVAFSVRTNVMYDGTLDDDSPVHGCAVRYKT